MIEKSFTPSDDLLVARNTFEETVDFIVKDLDEAASILPLNGDKARATKGAAMALKARVLLYAASDLFVSQSLWASGYEHPELIGYVGPAQASVSRITSKALIFIITLLGYLPM